MGPASPAALAMPARTRIRHVRPPHSRSRTSARHSMTVWSHCNCLRCSTRQRQSRLYDNTTSKCVTCQHNSSFVQGFPPRIRLVALSPSLSRRRSLAVALSPLHSRRCSLAVALSLSLTRWHAPRPIPTSTARSTVASRDASEMQVGTLSVRWGGRKSNAQAPIGGKAVCLLTVAPRARLPPPLGGPLRLPACGHP